MEKSIVSSKVKKIYACECWSEAVEIQVAENNNIEMCFWQLGLRPRNTPFKEKLRWIWFILTHNDFWSDECILSKETARELANDILKLTDSPESSG